MSVVLTAELMDDLRAERKAGLTALLKADDWADPSAAWKA
jgi:hypothetical protein